MFSINLVKEIGFLKVSSLITVLTVMGAVLTFGMDTKVRAATFTEGFDAGELTSDSEGPVIIPLNHKIEGNLLNTVDIDLYQLQFELDALVTVEFFGDIFLFDEMGSGLLVASDQLTFNGFEGDNFFLGINGSVALNDAGEIILDPNQPSFIGPGTLDSWEPRIGLPVVLPYTVSLSLTIIPEPITVIGSLAAAGIGIAIKCNRKQSLLARNQNRNGQE